MDTRTKIIPIDDVAEAVSSGKWSIVAGQFDPLTSENAAYISTVASEAPDRSVLVMILPSERANLPAEARAHLVAALRSVSLVSIGSWSESAQNGSDVKVFFDPNFEQQHSERFIELILHRQKADA